MTDEDFRPDPGRILYSAGIGFSADAPPDVLSRQLSDIPDVAPQKRAQWIATTPTRDRSPRAEAKVKAAKRTRPHRGGRPKGMAAWNRNDDITIERILAARDRGLNGTKEIGAALHCKPGLVETRLREWRRAFPAEAAARGITIVCPTIQCKRAKRWDLEFCCVCARAEQTSAARADRDADNARINQQIAELESQGLSHYQIAVQLQTTTSQVSSRVTRMRRLARLVDRGVVKTEEKTELQRVMDRI